MPAKIQIAHPNPEVLEGYVQRVLNLASMCAGGGVRPTDMEAEHPRQFGRMPWPDDEDPARINLLSVHNDDFAQVTAMPNGAKQIRFWGRYDQRKGDPFWRAFCEMAARRWPDEVENESTVFI